MSLFDYQQSQRISAGMAAEPSFEALIMAAIRVADTRNARALGMAFPLIYDELRRRYNAPGGQLPGDPDYEQIQAVRAALQQG